MITNVVSRNIAGALLYVLSVLLLPMQAHGAAQLPEPELSWKNVNVDGNKTAVFCIFKDSRDIVWLGTNNGLYFYDGVTSHPVGETELYGTQVYSIVENNDRLYIGCNNGLMVYDYATGLVSGGITDAPREIRVLYAVDDYLWIGSLNGIFRLDLRGGSPEDYSRGLPHKSVYSILRDSRGILYAGTYNGLARWDSNAGMFVPVKIKTDTGGACNSLFVNCMLEADDRESIYIGGEGILLRYTPANERWERVTSVGKNNVKSLSKDASGHILIGTDNGVFDMSGDSIKHFRHDSRQELSLADNEIWCMFADNMHNIWAGHERGFSIASNSNSIRTLKLSTLARSGEGNEIHSIYRDSKGNLWFGGTNGVIRLSANATPDWYRHTDEPKSLSHNRVRAIHEDMAHNLWFTTDAGINRFAPDDGTFDVFHIVDENGEHNSNWVYAMVEDGDHFWIGSFLNGLHYVEKSKFNTGDSIIVSDKSINTETEPLKLTNDLVNDVIKDRNGDIWILLFRDNILTRLNPASGRISTYDIHKLTGGYPTHINTDRSGKVWCAFKGGVIIFNTENDDFKTIKFPPTNSDETPLSMGPVGDGMWVSTLSNVWSVDGNTPKGSLLPIPQKSYTAVYEDRASNKVYLGGIDEIVEVDRNIIEKTTGYGTIRMILNDCGEGYFNLSEPGGSGRGMTIPYGGSITLLVSSLDYSPESVQRYMYKLAESPADTLGGWVVMAEGSNSISFSDLKMGKYNVLVKTIGSPLAPVAIPLTVKPPFALSLWAIIAYIIIAIAVISWIVWYMRKRNLRAIHERERQTTLDNVERKLTFLSNISHDLKTPLSMIIGPVSLLKEKAKDPDSKKSLEAVYDNAVRLNNMIHRTLELQHLEDSDENLLILSIFDVVDFCKGVFEVFKENNPQKNFIFHTSSRQIFIEADAVKFESVITNLLSNACKYSDEGSTISCGISKQDDNVEIVVSDDGIGISDIDQPLVFQRMFRAPSTSKVKEGTGLGLYLIKKYLELMNGNISLYSKEGQGTSFVVTLPTTEKISVKNRQDVTATDNGGKPKILIAEDNGQIAEFISDILKDDYTSLTADNGRSGLAIASSFIPDLIIADEMMPIMSGLEMVRQLKQNPRLLSIPIIMLTAKSDNNTENESIKLGIDVFMSKPFEPAALLGRITQLLKTRSEIKEKVRIQAITEAESKPIEAETANEKALAKIAKIIEENISDPDLNVNFLCEKSGVAPKQLYRLIKKYMGISPLDYIRRVRLQKAAVLLSQQRFTVSEICYMVGFKTPSYFARCFQAQFGVKPSQYQSDDSTGSSK
ncbi:MAG: helix-turn-helix domain-containing protein [Muribaculaceae bacterium]|nr:helix-turn-helix domain-containing protein [Muribaculaceae bacterium]